MVFVSYSQVPVGWWQDAKGTMQPPGSYLAPSLRIPTNGSAGVESGTMTLSPRSRFKKWTSARPSVVTRPPREKGAYGIVPNWELGSRSSQDVKK